MIFWKLYRYIGLFCEFNAYPNIHYVWHFQVMGKCKVCELARFFFLFPITLIIRVSVIILKWFNKTLLELIKINYL